MDGHNTRGRATIRLRIESGADRQSSGSGDISQARATATNQTHTYGVRISRAWHDTAVPDGLYSQLRRRGAYRADEGRREERQTDGEQELHKPNLERRGIVEVHGHTGGWEVWGRSKLTSITARRNSAAIVMATHVHTHRSLPHEPHHSLRYASSFHHKQNNHVLRSIVCLHGNISNKINKKHKGARWELSERQLCSLMNKHYRGCVSFPVGHEPKCEINIPVFSLKRSGSIQTHTPHIHTHKHTHRGAQVVCCNMFTHRHQHQLLSMMQHCCCSSRGWEHRDYPAFGQRRV